MNEIITKFSAIYCNGNSWLHLNEKINELAPSQIFIITDTNTNEYCLAYFIEKTSLKNYKVLTFAAGEEYKTIETCITIWDKLLSYGADRSSLLINLGGGVVTDLGGFIASTYLRGINFIQVPTTLLAMVDASVGGKNGVDFKGIKNQIGTITVPQQVIIDTSFLNTLPKNEFISGYAEMLKHGLIESKDYWNSIQDFSIDNEANRETAIWKSVLIKNKIVSEDPFEKNRRKTLNFGHTLGHAIETYFLQSKKHETLLHGEAIAIGMILALYLSSKLVEFPTDDLTMVTSAILKHFPKVSFSENDIKEILELTAFDKKNRSGVVHFVLLQNIGSAKINCIVPNNLIIKSFEYYKNF